MSGSIPLREHVLKPLAVRGFFICVPLAIACDPEVSWSVRIRHELGLRFLKQQEDDTHGSSTPGPRKAMTLRIGSG